MSVRVGVIPAAGLGRRFLPFTKAVPKELLPVGSQPAIQRIIDECLDAGIEHLIVVTSRNKPALEAYLHPSPGLVADLRAAGHTREADAVEQIGRDVDISVVYQDEPRGLGHAVGCAERLVGGRPFAVLLPDEIMDGASLLRTMIDVHGGTGGGVVGLQEVPDDQLHRYGIVAPAAAADSDGVIPIRTMVEKPQANAPSNLAIIGRYVLTPDVFDLLHRTAPGAGGEIQLTDALRAQAGAGPFHGVVNRCVRHDTGNPLGWFQAVVDTVFDDPEIGPDALEWLRRRLANER